MVRFGFIFQSFLWVDHLRKINLQFQQFRKTFYFLECIKSSKKFSLPIFIASSRFSISLMIWNFLQTLVVIIVSKALQDFFLLPLDRKGTRALFQPPHRKNFHRLEMFPKKPKRDEKEIIFLFWTWEMIFSTRKKKRAEDKKKSEQPMKNKRQLIMFCGPFEGKKMWGRKIIFTALFSNDCRFVKVNMNRCLLLPPTKKNTFPL